MFNINDISANVGSRIQQQRELKGMSKQALACNISDILDLKKDMCYQTITNWENGNTTEHIELNQLYAICAALDCDIRYILGFSDYQTLGNEAASKLTGLSEDAIIALEKSNKCESSFNESLSWLICNYESNFRSLITSLYEFVKRRLLRDRFNFINAEGIGYAYDNCTRYLHAIGDEAKKDELLADDLMNNNPALRQFYDEKKRRTKKKN